MITLVGGADELASLMRCAEAVAVVDGSERALSGVHAVPGTESSLEAIITPLLLRALGLAGYDAKLVACGITWEISPEAQARILQFFTSFREIADRYGQ